MPPSPDSPVVSEEQIAEVAQRLARAFSPQAVYLFGSHAYGAPRADSDVDILVVLPGVIASTWTLGKRGYGCLDGLGLTVELHFTSQERFDRRSSVPGSFEHEIRSKGRLLYAA